MRWYPAGSTVSLHILINKLQREVPAEKTTPPNPSHMGQRRCPGIPSFTEYMGRPYTATTLTRLSAYSMAGTGVDQLPVAPWLRAMPFPVLICLFTMHSLTDHCPIMAFAVANQALGPMAGNTHPLVTMWSHQLYGCRSLWAPMETTCSNDNPSVWACACTHQSQPPADSVSRRRGPPATSHSSAECCTERRQLDLQERFQKGSDTAVEIYTTCTTARGTP